MLKKYIFFDNVPG